jgi:hypothetical protein
MTQAEFDRLIKKVGEEATAKTHTNSFSTVSTHARMEIGECMKDHEGIHVIHLHDIPVLQASLPLFKGETSENVATFLKKFSNALQGVELQEKDFA